MQTKQPLPAETVLQNALSRLAELNEDKDIIMQLYSLDLGSNATIKQLSSINREISNLETLIYGEDE